MKKITYFIGLLTAMLVGCEKEEKVTFDGNATVTTALSTDAVVLEKDNADQTILSVSSEVNGLNVKAVPSYEIVFSNGKKSEVVTVSELPYHFTVSRLNNIATRLELVALQPTDVKVSVKGKLGVKNYLNFEEKTIKITAYKDVFIPTEWGVVGSATPNGWDGPDVPFWNQKEDANNFVAYVTLKDGEIKFRKNNKWDENLGGSGGTLSSGGSDIKVTAGTYKILLNVSAKTYSIEKYSWGIVGDGANGWDENKGTDIKLAYEGSTNTWVAKDVTLKAGQIKFRLNDSWATNFGADSSVEPEPAQSGNLKAGGKNIASKDGTFTIEVNFEATPPTYSIK